MCSIFGMNKIPDEEKMFHIFLGLAGEERGTDATGVGLLKNKQFYIQKAPVKASKFDWSKIKTNADFYLGHTRKTTQGDEKDNYNNHPFIDNNKSFILAHNGVITNDLMLKNQENLDNTEIETDSYVVTQLMETLKYTHQKDEIDIKVIQETVEMLQGSFALTILTKDKLFLLRHDKPLYIIQKDDLLIYASTYNMFYEATQFSNSDVPINMFNVPPLEIREDIIYEYDLNSNEFVDSLEFTVLFQKNAKTYNYNNIYDNNFVKGPETNENEIIDTEYNISNHFITKTKYMKLPYKEKAKYIKCDSCSFYFKRGYGDYYKNEYSYLCDDCAYSLGLEFKNHVEKSDINDI